MYKWLCDVVVELITAEKPNLGWNNPRHQERGHCQAKIGGWYEGTLRLAKKPWRKVKHHDLPVPCQSTRILTVYSVKDRSVSSPSQLHCFYAFPQVVLFANSTFKIKCLYPYPSSFSHALAASPRSTYEMKANPLARPVSRSLAKNTLVTLPKRSNISLNSCSSAISETWELLATCLGRLWWSHLRL